MRLKRLIQPSFPVNNLEGRDQCGSPAGPRA